MSINKNLNKCFEPEGGIDPAIAAQVKFSSTPSKFIILDKYCLKPKCDCREVTLVFYESVDGIIEFPHFELKIDVDSWKIKGHYIYKEDFDCEAMIKEFIRDVDEATKYIIRKRFETGKKYGGDQLREDLDPTVYKPGNVVAYNEIFNSPQYYRFFYGNDGINYSVLDWYCINPNCKCEDVALEFFSQKEKEGPYSPLFIIRLKFKPIKVNIENIKGELSKNEVETIYLPFMNRIGAIKSNKSNKLNLKLFKDRYRRIKKLNLAQLSREPKRSYPEVQQAEIMDTNSAGRNDPCPCGSGKKYKKCCLC